MNGKNVFNLTLLLVLLLIFAVACALSPSKQTTSEVSKTPAPTASPAQADDGQEKSADDENEKLKEKVAELEKKMSEQEKQKTAPQVRQTESPTQNSGATAWVNSPGDGFLALRSEPSADVGYRILQIPHGEYVRVLGCQSFSQRIGGRNGRWCRVNYEGYTGWVFDGWLVY